MSDNEKPTTDYGTPSGYGPHGGGSSGGIHVSDEPPHHGMSPVQYIGTRFTSLKPPMSSLPNPFRLLRMLTAHHWAFFGVAFFAWVCPSFFFFPFFFFPYLT